MKHSLRALCAALSLSAGAESVAQGQSGFGTPGLLPMPTFRGPHPAALQGGGPAPGVWYGPPQAGYASGAVQGGPSHPPTAQPAQGPRTYVVPAGGHAYDDPPLPNIGVSSQPPLAPVPAETLPPNGYQPGDGNPYPGGYESPYNAAMAGGYGEGACGAPSGCCAPSYGGLCGAGGCGPCGGCRSPWFGSLAGLYMTRDRGNKLFTTYETNNNVNQLQHSQQADADWAGGWQGTFGRCFGCQKAIEVTYWGLDELDGDASIRSQANLLSTPLDLELVQIGADLAADFFDNAREHRIRRTNEIHNLEINLLQVGLLADSCNRFRLSCLAGVRYLKFDENLLFGTVSGGNEFGSAGGINEAYLNVDVENNLVGFQIGGQGEYFLGPRFGLFGGTKLGVYGNHVDHRSQLYRGDGLSSFDIVSDKNDVALLGELSFGGRYYLSQRWSIFGGYRAIGVSGVALADTQVPFFLIDRAEFEDVDTNGSLILHGAFAGVACNY
jgi:hypothetical protein